MQLTRISVVMRRDFQSISSEKRGMSPHSSLQRVGFVELFIAVGIVCILGVISLTMQITQRTGSRRLLERVNRVEAFYSGEMLAWHAALREADSLAVGGTVTFENDYATQTIAALTPDAYVTGPGESLNISATTQYAPIKVIVRRLTSNNFESTRVSSLNNAHCGRVGFLGFSEKYRVCLGQTGGTGIPKIYIATVGTVTTTSGSSIGTHYLRLLSNGTVDENFGPLGVVGIAHPGAINGGNYMYPIFNTRPDGSSVGMAGGYLYHMLKDGQLDFTYGSNGFTALSLTSSMSNWVWPGLLSPSGAFLAPQEDTQLVLYRYLINGLLDGDFGVAGKLELDIETNDAQALETPVGVLHGQSSIYCLVGFATAATPGFWDRFTLIKTDLKGRLDSAFANQGKLDISGLTTHPQFAVLPDGAIAVFAQVSSGSAVYRFRPDGSADAAFGQAGRVDLGPAALRFITDGNSRFLAWRQTQNPALTFDPTHMLNFLTRHFMDGTVDVTFGLNGTLSVPDTYGSTQSAGSGTLQGLIDVIPDKDGALYTFGAEYATNSFMMANESTIQISHWRADGTLDTSFGENGMARHSIKLHPTTYVVFRLID
ncbi:MAG: hypothetical protein HYZ71_10130 [Deltaproteobacteria bacterium]|nr:hypothetical protein [Deltaproteobacteria bacterium]